VPREAAAFSAEVLHREITRFGDEIAASLLAEVESLAGIGPDALADFIRADLDRAVGAVSDRRPPNDDELAASAAAAADLARAGIPIDTVLRARRLAIRRACELLQEAGADAGLDTDAQVECIYRLWEWADEIQVSDSEAHRIAGLELSGDDGRRREWFVRALLMGGLSHSEVASRATAYGLLPGATYRAFRARPSPDADARALERAIRKTGAHDDLGVLAAPMGGDLCGVVTRRPELAGEGIVGLGMEIDLVRLGVSFEAATRALETALAFGYDGVVALEDLSLRPAVMAEAHLGERLVSRYIDPLHELGAFGGTLEATVREYLSNGMRIDEAAKALFVHPNTLRHRLDRFQQLTGADLRNAQDLVEVWWALERRALDGRG
jgi:hypothetical protein